MSTPTIFEACQPRPDILAHTLTEADFAADLAKVLNGAAPPLYQNPAIFFANTHPTRGLKNLLSNIFGRLAMQKSTVSSIFRLNTNYGGGKTHALIALAHVANGMQGVANIAEFIDPALVPKTPIVVAAFDGENADPANGRLLAPGLAAHTPWGELAWALGGWEGYESVRRSDETGAAPGAETLQRLLDLNPSLILMDELAVYLRKAQAVNPAAGLQLTPFLTDLFKAVEHAKCSALVYTLAVGKTDAKGIDAFAQENEKIARVMTELESVSGRKATLLDPTEEDETVLVLRRRLFEKIDPELGRKAVDAYIRLWNVEKEKLAQDSQHLQTRDKFYAGYPFHPELMDTLTEKTATIGNFQRVRGMLRILSRMIERLWQKQQPAHALHLHHIDPSFSPIRQEILTRWKQDSFTAALKADIAATEGDAPALSEQIDADRYVGLAPYAENAARAIFLHSLAFNEDLKGATKMQLRYSILGPESEIIHIDDAIRLLTQESAYLDDRPNHPLRFLSEPNLNQIIRQKEAQVNFEDVRRTLNLKIQDSFKTDVFNAIFFPSASTAVPDNMEKPVLAVMGHQGTSIRGNTVAIPDLVKTIFRYKSQNREPRLNLNNIVFLVAEEEQIENMQSAMRYNMALQDLVNNREALEGLAPHQREELKKRKDQSETNLAIAIQRCYRHLFYPGKKMDENSSVPLVHAAIEIPTSADKPGKGQEQIISVLKKLRRRGSGADSAEFMSLRTSLKRGIATTLQLFEDYRQDPGLNMLEDESVLAAWIRTRVKNGDFIYRENDLIWSKDDAEACVRISPDAELMTINYARDNKIWPKQKPTQPEPSPPVDPGPTPTPQHGVNERPIKTVVYTGLVNEAISNAWAMARQNKFKAIAEVQISMSEPEKFFILLGLLNFMQNCQKYVPELSITCANNAGDAFDINYAGSFGGAGELKEFLQPRMRAAAQTDGELVCVLKFAPAISVDEDRENDMKTRLASISEAQITLTLTAREEE